MVNQLRFFHISLPVLGKKFMINSFTLKPIRRHYHPKYTTLALALDSYPRSSIVSVLHRHHKGVGSISAKGYVVGESFSTVSGLIFVMCFSISALVRVLKAAFYCSVVSMYLYARKNLDLSVHVLNNITQKVCFLSGSFSYG